MGHRPGMTFDQCQMAIGMLIGGKTTSRSNIEQHFGVYVAMYIVVG